MTHAHRYSCYLSVIKSVFWIRIGFNADPDSALYLNPDPDPGPGSQTNAHPDPDPGQTLKTPKDKFSP
jgi:hypothetical protein